MSAVSARGLFRATGKTAAPLSVVVSNDLLGEVETPEYLPREKDDFYPTPPEPTRAFLHAEFDRLKAFPLIWEPSAGDGAMTREIASAGLPFAASDLVDRGCGAIIKSFYDFQEPLAQAIVTNPPWNECDGELDCRYVRHAVQTLGVEYCALLLPWKWPAAANKAQFWSRFPPARVYLMRWRIDWQGNGANPSNDAWHVWDRQHQGETILRMLDRKDARQGELL